MKHINVRCLDCGYAESWPFEPSACPSCKAAKAKEKYQPDTGQQTIVYGEESGAKPPELESAVMLVDELQTALSHMLSACGPEGWEWGSFEPEDRDQYADLAADAREFVQEHNGPNDCGEHHPLPCGLDKACPETESEDGE